MKIDEKYFLVSKKVDVKKNETIQKSTNHIFVVDVSYSMMNDLPKIKKQLKNKLPSIISDGDTITVIWFSGKNQAGILKEEVEIKSLESLNDFNNAVDKWLSPIGMTAFLKPLELVKDVVTRIRNNRPDSNFSMMFLTDGYNNDVPWPNVIKALKDLEYDLSASCFVEYGYYADSQKLTEMASILGCEKIFTKDFDDFEPNFNERISQPVNTTKKIVLKIEDSLYDFAYSINHENKILIYKISDGELLVGDDVDNVYYFSEKGKDDNIQEKYVYGGIYVLSDNLMNYEAEKLFYKLGDIYYYKQLVNAYGKQKLNEFKNSILDCVKYEDKRYPESKAKIQPVNDDAYCLIDLIEEITKYDDIKFLPNVKEFKYNRIGSKKVNKKHSLSEEEKEKLSKANSIDEAKDILSEIAKNNSDLEFVANNPNDGYPINNLVWNNSRANLSVNIRIDGKVKLPHNKFGIDNIDTFKYRTYTIIKDGIVNVDLLPISMNMELYDKLLENKIPFSVHTISDDKGGYMCVNLKTLPIINRKMVQNISAISLAKIEWELLKIKADNKVYKYYYNELSTKESKTFVDTYGKECADWLKTLGITDYNGFAPKMIEQAGEDFYQSVELNTKIKGLSSLPKITDVEKKIASGKDLKTNEKILSTSILAFENEKKSEIFKSLDENQQKTILINYLDKKTKELNIKKKKIMQKVAEIKFSLILSKKWFKEFKSFDENKLNLKIDGDELTFTFDLAEKKVTI